LNKKICSTPKNLLLLLDENNKIILVNNSQEIKLFIKKIENYLKNDHT